MFQPSTSYKAPLILFNGHLQTIVPALTRKVKLPKPYERERIDTPDGDFLDLDWLKNDHKKLLILCHGLEGSSDRPYILGMARHFFQHQFDVLAWNYRGCSGEVNQVLKMYHSGKTEDLDLIVKHAAKNYQEIYLIGFSLGANLMLKYLGEQGKKSIIKRSIAFSVPLDLHNGVIYLDRGFNMLYAKRFLKTLKKKILLKYEQFPDDVDITPLPEISTVYDFDDTYTSRIHGFNGAADYYYKCSSIRFVAHIHTPTLIVNAANDTMIGKIAIQPDLKIDNPSVQFLLTRQGGHCGFSNFNKKTYWSEKTALEFIHSK